MAPEFSYEGVDKLGKKVTGKLQAPTEGDLRILLRGQGVRPTRIRSVSLVNRDLGSMFKSGGGNVNLNQNDLVLFTRQMQVLINSGIPLVNALDILHEQAATSNLRNLCMTVRTRVSEGAYLWESLAKYPGTFSKLYVSLVRAGESSGSLDQMLRRLTRYLEDAQRLRSLLKSAMMYPTVVISVGIGVVCLMMIFVIPKFEALLTGSGQELPGPTKFVIDMSHFLVNNALYIFGGGGLLLYLFIRYVRSQEGRVVMDRLLFRAPIFGPIMQKGAVARFTRTLHTLLASGVNLLDAFDICKATVDNAVVEQSVAKLKPEIEKGKQLGAIMAKDPNFPKMAVQMIQVGETTGALDKMLEKVADFYEAEVETLVGGMTKMIEPLILVFLGGTVGGLMIAMYLPIFKMAGGAGD